MAEKPILFNTEMVRAILDGRKTVTRRVVPLDIVNGCDIESDGKSLISYENDYGDFIESSELCRYRPNDILWVRETWKVQAAHRFESDVRIMFKAGGPLSTIRFPGGNSQATSRDDYDAFIDKWMQGDGWRPSIHMPREAARIWLRVTGVRVERLQEMRAEDSLREGVKLHLKGCLNGEDLLKPFADLWDSTINPADRDRYGWAANPWVWVIAFERTERPVTSL